MKISSIELQLDLRILYLSIIHQYTNFLSLIHISFKLVGGIAKGHPDEEDMKNAVDFVKGLH